MKLKTLSLLLVALAAGSCTGESGPADPNPTPHDFKEGPGVFSKDGNLLSAFKGLNGDVEGGSAVMGVNAYIWRASLQAVSFLPLIQADSAGGVIITDWVNQEDNKDQQVKVNIYITSKKLEPNALKVKVFTRKKLDKNSYTTPKLDTATATALEETVLSKARVLKIKAQAE